MVNPFYFIVLDAFAASPEILAAEEILPFVLSV